MALLKFSALATGLALGLAVAAFPSASRADIFVQTSDHCTGGCNINPLNTINVTGGGGTITFTLNLAPNWFVVGSGLPVSFGFSSSIATLTPNALTGYTTVGPAGATGVDGVGTFPATFYGWDRTANGFAGHDPNNPVVFTLTTAATLTLAQFIASLEPSSTGPLFVADVINNNTGNGNTGAIDFGGTAVPLPPAALLFGTALAGLGILGRRRKKALATPFA